MPDAYPPRKRRDTRRRRQSPASVADDDDAPSSLSEVSPLTRARLRLDGARVATSQRTARTAARAPPRALVAHRRPARQPAMPGGARGDEPASVLTGRSSGRPGPAGASSRCTASSCGGSRLSRTAAPSSSPPSRRRGWRTCARDDAQRRARVAAVLRILWRAGWGRGRRHGVEPP